MKKLLALILVIATLACAMIGCGQTGNGGGNQGGGNNEGGNNGAPEFNPNEKSEGSMTHAEYLAAAEDAEVVIEAYIQGKQSWWQDKARFYLQDGDGGYFVYDLPCTEAEYNTLTVGTKIKVTGYKTQYKGEIEIDEGATFEIIPGTSWVATPTDVTALLGTDELAGKMNMLVSFKDMTVKSVEVSGEGGDIYVTFTKGDAEYNFCVESYLIGTGPDSDVYKTVAALEAGAVVDVEGFLYWWEGPNTQLTKVTVK